MGWGEEEFKTIELGDERLNRRAVLLAERLGQSSCRGHLSGGLGGQHPARRQAGAPGCVETAGCPDPNHGRQRPDTRPPDAMSAGARAGGGPLCPTCLNL